MTRSHHPPGAGPYDLIVIGAGSAGCVVAARASEDPARTVLLIEAGPDYPLLAELPRDLRDGRKNSYRDHDWGLEHRPTAGRTAAFPRGRVTGGSSAVNTTIALRGVPEDYDEWAARGNPAWAWERVLPAFKRLERDLDHGDQPYHGDAGPIPIRRHPEAELLRHQAAFLERAAELGHPACPDANRPDDHGAGPHPMNKLGDVRISCAAGYLAPARIRPNLVLRADTLVRRLRIEGGHCAGVEVETADGRVEQLEARLVVLCAGAIMSPAILLRSGLGPRAELEALGIDVVHDLAGVGRNLCDHPALSLVCVARDPALADPDQPVVQTLLRYTAEGSRKRNDLQLEPVSFVARNGPPLFMIAAVLEYVYGRGVLRLGAADPHVAPVIEQRFCEDPRDAARLAACFEQALAFARSGPLADLIAEVRFPDPSRALDREGAMELCRRLAGSGFHPCGTARMGPASDPDAVVDERGRCHALDQLVVADASILPSVPRANTNLTCIMVGERVGEWLRTQPASYGL